MISSVVKFMSQKTDSQQIKLPDRKEITPLRGGYRLCYRQSQ